MYYMHERSPDNFYFSMHARQSKNVFMLGCYLPLWKCVLIPLFSFKTILLKNYTVFMETKTPIVSFECLKLSIKFCYRFFISNLTLQIF